MPGPDEALGKNQQSGGHDGEPDNRGRVAHVIACTNKQDEGDIAQPTESNE